VLAIMSFITSSNLGRLLDRQVARFIAAQDAVTGGQPEMLGKVGAVRNQPTVSHVVARLRPRLCGRHLAGLRPNRVLGKRGRQRTDNIVAS